MRRFIGLFFLVVCVVAQAQTETWQAWLYDPGSGEVLLMDGRGFIQDQDHLPLTRNMSSYPYNVAVSASGSHLAYVLSDTTRSELIVYDIRPGHREIVLQYVLPAIAAESIGQSSTVGQLFAPDETHLAFGSARQGGGWEIVILDTSRDQATLILRGGAGPAADLNVQGVVPVVRAFDGVDVAFTLVPYPAQGVIGASRPAYLWDTQTNTLQPAPAYQTLDTDVFAPTGEIVQASSEQGAVSLFSSPSAQDALTLASVKTGQILYPHFVQNGMAVLYTTYDDRNRPTRALLRRGETQPLTWALDPAQIMGSVRGTAEGFAYTIEITNGDDTNVTTLYRMDLTDGLSEPQVLYTATTSTHPRLIWLNDPHLTSAPVWTAPQPTPSVPQSVYTQEDTWQAWVYQDNGLAARIDSQGQALDFEAIPPENALPGISDSDILRPSRLAASPDGEWLIYALGVNTSLYVQVYETRQNRVLMTYRIDGSEGTRPPYTLERAAHNLLNESQTALAFGYGKESGWQIDIVDVGSSQLIMSLTPEDPLMRALITDVGFGVVPVIQSFHEGKVHFTIQGAGTFAPPYPSFVWDTVLNTVNPTLLYANPMNDTFPLTGEVVMAMIDARLPNTADRFLYGQLNTLHVYDPATGTRTPFYNAPTLWLQTPHFIQNGERILSGGVDASGAFEGWTVLERDGEVAGLLPLMDDLVDAAGTGSGFVYIPRDETGGALTLSYVDTRQALDAGRVIWSIPLAGRPQIVWTGYPTQTVTYRPWRALSVPIDVGAVSAETTPQPATQLIIGGTAVVRTTGGDALLLRAEAGPDAAVVTRLNSGTRVTLVDGPTMVGETPWWQVRTPGGVAGWVVGEADGLKTLTPEE